MRGLVALSLGIAATATALPPRNSGNGQSAGGGRTTGHSAPGYLGIDMRDVSDDEIVALKLKDTHGAEITKVDHDGPAGKMGLRERDVVVKLNGSAIEGEEQMRRMLHDMQPGRTVALLIMRDGLPMLVTAQMADKTEIERQAWELHVAVPPSASSGPNATESDQAINSAQPASSAPAAKYSRGFIGTLLMIPSYTGITLERMGPQLAQYFGAPRGTGLLVKGVENNSPAEMAGIRAGDVVLRADARALTSTTDWAKVVHDAKGRPVSVVVLRDHQEKTLSMIPDARKHSSLSLPLPWERSSQTTSQAALRSGQ
jgi:S1-C subfamily serine protease